MPTFVILLRGVNVGKAKRVPMADFRELLEGLGFSSITTLLNSGNAVAIGPRKSSGSLAKTVAKAMEATFGFEVPVIVKTSAELTRAVDGNQFARDAKDHSHLLVVFSQDSDALEQLQPIGRLVTPREQFAIGSDAAYLHCAGGILESKAAEALLGKVGKAVTTRNWATVLKLHALATNGA